MWRNYIKKKSKKLTNKQKEKIIEQALSSPKTYSSISSISKAMTETDIIRKQIGYESLARKIFKVQELPIPGSVNYYRDKYSQENFNCPKWKLPDE